MKKINFESYLKTLETQDVDVLSGRILSEDTVVICSPFNTKYVAEDTPDNRKRFLEYGCVWDEPTRVLRVKELVNQLSYRTDYGNIRSVDISYELNMSVSMAESIIRSLVRDNSEDYDITRNAVDAQGKTCISIVKKR